LDLLHFAEKEVQLPLLLLLLLPLLLLVHE